MQGKQSLILVTGGSLVIANLAGNNQGVAIWKVIWSGEQHHNQTEMRDFLIEVLFIGLLVFAAGFSDAIADVILLILAGLWFLWLARRFGSKG